MFGRRLLRTHHTVFRSIALAIELLLPTEALEDLPGRRWRQLRAALSGTGA
jgi:hypothetical protein